MPHNLYKGKVTFWLYTWIWTDFKS